MRTLDQIYWDTLCTKECKCACLEDALYAHPDLVNVRGVSELVKISYTNWKGETADRVIKPGHFHFGQTQYHREEQWLLTAYDVNKKQSRTFAMKDIHKWEPFIRPAPKPVRTSERGDRGFFDT